MPKCMECHKQCRKMYMMHTEDDGRDLVCKSCALKFPLASICPDCKKPFTGQIHFTYDWDGKATPHHKACYLKVIEADPDDMLEYIDEGMI